MPDPKPYLDYLDKEMTIMGILSTFCLGIPVVLVERVVSTGKESLCYDFLSSLVSSSSTILILSLLLILVSAILFYKQRSLLAWFYGQIALEATVSGYTGVQLDQWLKDADSWETWIPYIFAFWILIAAGAELSLAILSATFSSVHAYAWYYALGVFILMVGWLAWLYPKLVKCKYEDEVAYFSCR